ncbi:MAG: hypothetical protein ACK4HE_04010 [Chitinophagaceae bacterium]
MERYNPTAQAASFQLQFKDTVAFNVFLSSLTANEVTYNNEFISACEAHLP